MKHLQPYIKAHGGYQSEHPDYSHLKWVIKVQLGETREGYWEWCYRQDWETGPACLECNDTGFVEILGQHKTDKSLNIKACSTCM